MKKRNKICDYVEITMTIASFIAFLFNFFACQYFNAIQFLMMGICIIIPIILKIIFKVKFKTYVYIIYQLFILAHFFFGEVLSLYIYVSNYDTALHLLTAIFICFFTYSLLNMYSNNIKILFSVLIAMGSEYLWEILEFSIDHFFNTNMQRFIKNGMTLVGHNALFDTMKDMMIALLGCFVFIMFTYKRKNLH